LNVGFRTGSTNATKRKVSQFETELPKQIINKKKKSGDPNITIRLKTNEQNTKKNKVMVMINSSRITILMFIPVQRRIRKEWRKKKVPSFFL